MVTKVLRYLVIGLLTLGAAMSGVMKIVPVDMMVQNMAELGYGVGFTRFIGACWLAGAVGLWLPKWRSLACLGMLAILFGAVAAHITGGHGLDKTMGSVVYIVLTLVVLSIDGFWKKVVR